MDGAGGNPNERGIDREALIRVRSLRDAFRLFGVQDGDRIETRDLVIMTSQIEEEMRAAKQELHEKQEYDAAATVRDRLAALREEFISLQLETEERRRQAEMKNFDKATRRIMEMHRDDRQRASAELGRACEGRRRALQHSHEIQRQNLEDYIANMHRPRVRYSKGLLDLMHSEKHLARLNQFEEAKVLSRVIAQQRPKEVARHTHFLENRERVLRRNLKCRQDFEWEKLNEKLHDLELESARSQESQVALSRLRLGHHQRDMANRYKTSQPDRFCAVRGGRVRAVVQKRKGYLATDAAFRGTQLLDSVQGGAIKGVVSLCDIHHWGARDEVEFRPAP